MKLKFPASLSVIWRSIVDWWDSWLDLVGAVILWLLAQATIVLGPPATFGLFYTAHQLLSSGTSLGMRGVIDGGRKYFGKSWLWALISALGLLIVYTNVQFYGGFETLWGFYAQVFFLMLGSIWITTQLYAVAYVMEMTGQRMFVSIRNGFFTTMASPFFSFMIMAFTIVILVLSFLLVLPIFFGIPALVPILFIRSLYNRLEAYGLRERERTPKELEREQSSRIEVPRMEHVSDGKGQVEEQHTDNTD